MMKNIELHNCSCFEHLVISLKPGINLFIGDNASGKTSVLKALKCALSSFFTGFSDENTKVVGIGNDQFRHQFTTDGILMNEQAVIISFDVDDYITDETQNSFFQGNRLYSLKRNNLKSRTATKEIGDWKKYAIQLHKNMFADNRQCLSLPLFASFSTTDIHSSRKINSKLFKQYVHKPSFGYYECLQGDGFFPYWLKRMLVLKEARKGNDELMIVQNAVRTVLGINGCNIINDVNIRPQQGSVYFISTDGREIDSNLLSDGYKRLLNIVIDLAFRCALLNKGIYGNRACAETIGTVLIDEMDLHLNPSLQSKIINSLKSCFQKIQFVITTHAPLVMSSVRSSDDNIVYLFKYENDEYLCNEVNTYGLDASTMITNIMSLPAARYIKTDEELTELFRMIDDERYNDAKEKLKQLKEYYRDSLPELVKAETMINLLDS
jgi:Predicted ATP-binding protein involved in virulence